MKTHTMRISVSGETDHSPNRKKKKKVKGDEKEESYVEDEVADSVQFQTGEDYCPTKKNRKTTMVEHEGGLDSSVVEGLSLRSDRAERRIFEGKISGGRNETVRKNKKRKDGVSSDLENGSVLSHRKMEEGREVKRTGWDGKDKRKAKKRRSNKVAESASEEDAVTDLGNEENSMGEGLGALTEERKKRNDDNDEGMGSGKLRNDDNDGKRDKKGRNGDFPDDGAETKERSKGNAKVNLEKEVSSKKWRKVSAKDGIDNAVSSKGRRKEHANPEADDAILSKKKRKGNVEGYVDGIPSKRTRKEGVKDANGGAKKKSKGNDDESKNDQVDNRSRKVRFSDEVEVFPLPKDGKHPSEDYEGGLMQGKRFSPEENGLVRDAVLNYIKVHNLGENGVDILMNNGRSKELKGCWKEIGASLPWRPYKAVYYRAHILFEGDGKYKWDTEEYEILRRHYEKHGSDWKKLAILLRKHRFHIKDAWRRIKLPNRKTGQWSQDEYQNLFDLVNKDLSIRAYQEKVTKYGMLRDNIGWEAISQKLSTRTNVNCCKKWYEQLASPMIVQGLWNNSDDYRLLQVLQELDASCLEDVDWDNLLEHRSGNICLKRWKEMTKHIGGYKEKPFTEQVEVLSCRYSSDVLEAVETYESK